MPEGLYGAGTIIVADVSYNYNAALQRLFPGRWSTTQGSINFAHTAYMRPRTQTEIAYNPTTTTTGRTKCP